MKTPSPDLPCRSAQKVGERCGIGVARIELPQARDRTRIKWSCLRLKGSARLDC
jgi:hypothetical protein